MSFVRLVVFDITCNRMVMVDGSFRQSQFSIFATTGKRNQKSSSLPGAIFSTDEKNQKSFYRKFSPEVHAALFHRSL